MISNMYTEIGTEKLRILVTTFYNLVFSNPIISQLFDPSNREVVEDKQFLFLTQLLGGQSLYSEKYGHPRMKMRHAAHAINHKAKEEWLKCMYSAIQTMDLDPVVKQKLYNVFPPVAEHMVNTAD